MKDFLKSKATMIGGGVAAAALMLLAPLSAFAAFTDGMVIPSGTTTNVTTALNAYFFPTLLATVFQNQVIEIVVVLAAVGIMWYILRTVWRKVHHPGR